MGEMHLLSRPTIDALEIVDTCFPLPNDSKTCIYLLQKQLFTDVLQNHLCCSLFLIKSLALGLLFYLKVTF